MSNTKGSAASTTADTPSGRCVQTLAAIDAGHRCPACHLEGQLQRLTADLNLVVQERNRLADEAIALRGQLAAAREERDIAVRRAARAVAERDMALGLEAA